MYDFLMNIMLQQWDHYIERGLMFLYSVFSYYMGDVGIVLA